MTEEILKIKADELTTIRLIFEDGIIHEMPLKSAAGYAQSSQDQRIKDALGMLVGGLDFFSKPNAYPSIEFVVPVKW
jgi:hypothetical protein